MRPATGAGAWGCRTSGRCGGCARDLQRRSTNQTRRPCAGIGATRDAEREASHAQREPLWREEPGSNGQADGGRSCISRELQRRRAAHERIGGVDRHVADAFEAALMTVRWLSRLTGWLLHIRNTLYTKIKSMPAWKSAVKLAHGVRQFFRSFRRDGLRRRWLAIRRKMSRKPPDTQLPSKVP